MTFTLDALPPQPDKIAVVTGANTGLGYETALGLARQQIWVVMACRSLERAAQARADIAAQVPGASLDILPVDLADLASVRRFAQVFRQRYDRLDLLINNAGIMLVPYRKTADGLESHMAVNYFGHFLLTALLLDLMPDRSDSRVVALSSNAHKFCRRIRFDDLPWEQGYSKLGAYAQSKLVCLMFALELQRRLERSGRNILSVAAHPGLAATELARYMPRYQMRLLQYTLGPFLSHPADGAMPTLMAALDPAVQGGEYFGPQGLLEFSGLPGAAPKSAYAQDPAVARRLWQVSEQLTDCEFRIGDAIAASR